MRKLASLGEYRLETIDDPVRLEAALDVFFAQKATRLDRSYIYNIFYDRANERFIRRLAHESLAADNPTLRLHALQVNDEIIAVAGGGMQGARFSMAINSMSERPEHVACSPGRICITMVVEQLCAQGFDFFDMGVGENRYKYMWCSPIALFEVNRVLSAKGRVLLGLTWLRSRAVARIKRSPGAMRLARFMLFHFKRLLP
jgi:CelD/BcsL family acetyltransferase involved in cellulose biosynthesis